MRANLDLSSKLALVLLLWTCAFTLPWIAQIALCILIVAIHFLVPTFRAVSERSAAAFSRFMLYSVVIGILLVSLNGLIIKEGERVTSFLGLSFYEAGLLFGLRTASRLILMSLSILMFFTSTPLKVIIGYLQSKGLSPSLVLVLLLTLHFIDQLPSRIRQIFLAQQARGAPVDEGIYSRSKALFAILSPLVLSSIVESIERGTALELRGFLNRPPTKEHSPPVLTSINMLTVSFCLISLALILITFCRWLSA